MASALGKISFIGRRPIQFLNNQVSLKIHDYSERGPILFGRTKFSKIVEISGKLGSGQVKLVKGLNCEISDGFNPDESTLKVEIDKDTFASLNRYEQRFVKSMHGTTNSLISNFIEGVTEGHQVRIKLIGVGYRASLENNTLSLRVGYSHVIYIPTPPGITAKVPIQTKIILSGVDRQKVTQLAALIRSKRPPEPYNGKGIFVDDEEIIRKEGKKTK